MNYEKKTFAVFFALLVFLLSGMVLTTAAYTSSNFQSSIPGVNLQGGAFSQGFDSNYCQAGQDFLLQIAPSGCEPAIVRSDLLEEQNVPVFCPIKATKLNPLIKVENIKSISFTGNYSSDVSGVGFYPARAAISSSQTQLSNSPILENIGYAVIVLRQNPNESSMPDFISGDLTAKITYDIEKSFGVGSAVYHTPVLTDIDWNNNYRQYSFWNGKGYVRASSVDSTSAGISIYSSKDNRVASFSLKKGQTSNEISLPGFYCSAGLKARLDGVENPTTRAKLNINGDIVQVARGESFLDNKCEVISEIKKIGINQEVSIGCNTDDGYETSSLKITPKIRVNVGGNVLDVQVGQKLYDLEKGGKSVYVGYIGTSNDNDKKLFIVPVISPVKFEDEFKNSAVYKSLPLAVKAITYDTGQTSTNLLKSMNVVLFGSIIDFSTWSVTGSSPMGFYYEGGDYKSWPDVKDFILDFIRDHEKSLVVEGFSEPSDVSIKDSREKENYDKAMEDYKTVYENYPSEKSDPDSIETFGEQALMSAIELASFKNQKESVTNLCGEFENRFPGSNSKPGICDDSFKISSPEAAQTSVLIGGRVKTISFERISEPTPEEFGAKILVERQEGGKSELISLTKNQIYPLNEDGTEYIKLVDLNTEPEKDFASIEVSLIREPSLAEKLGQNYIKGKEKLKKGIAYNLNSRDYVFTVEEINLKKVARVSVIPSIRDAGTEANLSFNVGIEKRAIQLSPDKVKEKIGNLNKTIQDWGEISDKLDKTVRIFNGMCLATGATLTVKNYFNNIDGKSIARQKIVMRSDGGWIDICSVNDPDNSKSRQSGESVDACLLRNSDYIDKDVEVVSEIIKNQNTVTDETLCSSLDSIKESITSDTIPDPRKPSDSAKALDFSTNSNLYAAFGKDAKENKCIQVSLTQARDLETAESIIKSGVSDEIKKASEINRYKILSDININAKGYAEYNKFVEDLKKQDWISGATNVDFQSSNKDAVVGIYGGAKSISAKGNIPEDSLIQPISFDNSKYYLSLKDNGGNKYSILDVYDENGNLVGKDVKSADGNANVVGLINSRYKNFQKYDSSSYENIFVKPEVSYFETEPYKGLPAIVPFDTKNGWYAATRQTIPGLGGTRSYDKSGNVVSFFLCNVGQNGKVDFESGEDICQGFNSATGALIKQFSGISDSSKVDRLVREAKDAVSQAERQYKPGVNNVRIGTNNIPVGRPSSNVPEYQCQDFMSPKDCLILFNACDPVVCPSSRCNLGGDYHVSDVVQSGIVGSTLLCLPNWNEGVKVPVCLTGIKAGIDGLTSVQQNYKDCLEENLRTGKTVGICDEIHSIYLCDFFWSQAQPISQVIIPRLFEAIKGQSPFSFSSLIQGPPTRGGGEYLGVQNAWQNAQNSLEFFSNHYAVNSFDAFKSQSTAGVGGSFCRNFLSATYPSNIDILAPDSPPSYTAWFQEQPLTTATVPATSQYKVFYHVYSGKNLGAYYNVYLKAPEGSSFYVTNPILNVPGANGYINVNDYASETRDFTAPSGYKQLCVRVNEQEECGFQKVTSSFAVDYLNDKYLSDQASRTDIKTEKECVSGTSSFQGLLNPNLQAGATKAVNPEIYNSGIIRICSTNNPGSGTDPKAGTSEGRWVQVGNCDDGKGNLKCYLDQNSVKENINSVSLEGQTLEQAQSLTDGLFESVSINFNDELKKVLKLDSNDKIKYINEGFLSKVFENYQKATFILLRADAYKALIVKIAESTANKRKLSNQIDTAIKLVENRQGNYYDSSENQGFIDGLCSPNAGLLTTEECNNVINCIGEVNVPSCSNDFSNDFNRCRSIAADSFSCDEYDMDYVRGILKKVQDQASVISVSQTPDTSQGSTGSDVSVEQFEGLACIALNQAKTRDSSSKYSDNKQFIDGLYENGLLTTGEYTEINGEGVFNLEENMEYVVNILNSVTSGFSCNPSGSSESGGTGPSLPAPESRVQTDLNDAQVKDNLALYDSVIREASQLYGVEEGLIKGIILQESSANRLAIGDDGASYGLMQVSKPAIEDVQNNFNNAVINSININNFDSELLDSKKNIHVGTAYFSLLQKYYSDAGNTGEGLKKISILAYNFGRGNVGENCKDNIWGNCQNIPSFNLRYVSDVLGFKKGVGAKT